MVAAPVPLTMIPTVMRPNKERPSSRSPLPPAPAPPIAPYDPYRPMTGDRPRSPTRNIAADPLEPSDRSSRAADDDPFLPADDPLSAEAWQLELDEAPVGGDDEATLPEFDIDAPLPPRRARRQPSSTRSGREPTPGARRAPRRSRSSTASARGRGARPGVTIAVPRVVSRLLARDGSDGFGIDGHQRGKRPDDGAAPGRAIGRVSPRRS